MLVVLLPHAEAWGYLSLGYCVAGLVGIIMKLSGLFVNMNRKLLTFFILLSVLFSACASGDRTVPESAIAPYSPTRPWLTYYEEIDPNISFMCNINLFYKKYMSSSEYKSIFYGSNFFYKKIDDVNLFKKLPEVGSCFQYLSSDEYNSAQEESKTLDQIFAGKVSFISPNYSFEMPQVNLSFGSGIATMGNYTANDEKNSIYINGELFTGFASTFDFTTDDSECLKNSCIGDSSVSSAIYFPDEFKLTPNADNFNKEVSESVGLSFTWENNNTVADDFDPTKAIYITIVLYDQTSQFSSYTRCGASDLDGKFDPTVTDSPFYQFINNILAPEKKPSGGYVTVERLSKQQFEYNGSPCFATISLQEEFEVDVK